MLQQQQYIREKLNKIEAARRHTASALLIDAQPAPHRRGPIGTIVRVAGRQVRRLGEALESWGTPQASAR